MALVYTTPWGVSAVGKLTRTYLSQYYMCGMSYEPTVSQIYPLIMQNLGTVLSGGYNVF